ncbi:C1 family peptidase [Clostridium saccharobutylicum]|uniref:Cysteine protease n=1 Tax=Clostridium saccharobutylicum DSM 13864 TaxID=1345695 RepID=U5MY39_CLOSA|nr:C1 family peptidase [Clostridium saccharobutylicum]AGX44551.1 cysteine protease [Clostridium saccharobutylicum DSM 13864]AQR91842.1 papain family cysteine protease [Clostridium saccharobutylicum]AQS01744.1 papain family cysteine protease [Clostridium saccharobutylicum]AQS11348.1 papain family cysteine protease [Clostridium saccharobutylicum]AQS15727.1 papain family cysteine protease [Clostridium saccharobutylicum]
MKFKKISIKIVSCLLFVFVSLITGQSSSAKTLHPTGLNHLHEKISGIKKVESPESKIQLPSQIDLSSKFPKVTDQGSLGSCVTFAIGYADKSYEEGVKLNWRLNTNAHLFSPAYIYSQIHLTDDPDGGGADFSDAFNLLKTQGCTTLADMPYDGSEYAWEITPTDEQIANAAKYKTKSWGQLPDGNYNAIKAQLANGNPVVIGIPVYPDFDNLNASNPIYDKVYGENRGGHALCVVGYDDSKKAVKIINSWGTNWGINGYGWISYNLIQSQGIEAYVMTDAN